MKYSDQQRAVAAAGASAVRTSRQPATPALPGQAIAASPAETRKPQVTFQIEKKVGDATLHVYGADGEEKDAKEAIDQAAERFRGNND